VIPAELAFGAIDAVAHVKLSGNRNPDLTWSGLPAGTKSLAVLCHDPDVPSKGDDVNKEGRNVPASLPRVDFFHWVLVDLRPDTPPIERGEFSTGVTARGKARTARAARRAAGHQRLHRVVRRRQGHGRQLFRLRRAMSSVERRDRSSLRVHAVRARRACASMWRGSSRAAMFAKRWQATSSPKLRSPAATRSIRQ
jgi:hypothetical protein